MGEVFSTEVTVRFGDCDPAGIVFYPRYFEMFNNLVEDWCARGLGTGFRELHIERRLGFPAVHIETDFKAPSELGDLLRAELRVEKIGGASLTVALRLCGADGGERVNARMILALMDLDKRRAQQIPAELRTRIARFCN